MDKEFMQALGERVHTLRRRKGESQQEIAFAVGASPTTISNIEKGKVGTITLDHLLGLARELGVSPNELLGWHEERKDG